MRDAARKYPFPDLRLLRTPGEAQARLLSDEMERKRAWDEFNRKQQRGER